MIASVKPETAPLGKKPLEEEMARLVMSIAESLYKTKPEITNYGASSSGVWGLHFENPKRNRVIKLGVKSSGSLLREQKIIQNLQKFELNIPEIEFTQEDLPSAWIPFMIMPKIGTIGLKEACSIDRPFALEKCRQTGEFLARLSRVPLSAIDIQPNFALMPDDFKDDFMFESIGMGKWQKVTSILKKWQVLTPELDEILLDVKNYTNIIHQDFIPRQILVGPQPQHFAVIDWESVVPGSTLIDIGDFLGGMSRSLRNKENRGTYTNAFLDGFCSLRPLSAQEMAEIALWEAYSTINVAYSMGRRNRQEQVGKFLGIALERSLIHEYKMSSST
jgi:aminoglycoside phosphotransferase (APT) family kinase protein